MTDGKVSEEESRSWIGKTSMILANQMLILACVFFLVLIELEVGMYAAGNVMSIMVIAAVLMYFSRPLANGLETVVEWWGGRSV